MGQEAYPQTFAAHEHRASYGSDAHLHDQPDGFFTPPPQAELQTQVILLIDKIKRARGDERHAVVSKASKLLRDLPPLAPVRVVRYSRLTRSGEVLTLADIMPEIGTLIDLLELVKVRDAPTRWICTRTGRQYDLRPLAGQYRNRH